MADPEVDAVDICLPTGDAQARHRTGGRPRQHVFCEKPIARTVSDAEAMAAACRRAGVVLMIGHVVRFFPDFLAARRAVQEGALGYAQMIRLSRLSPFPAWGSGDWFADEERSGGPILDLMIHDFDFIRWTFGEPRRVYARARRNYALVTLRLEKGAICHVEGSWAHPEGFPLTTKIEIAGTSGLYTDQSQVERPPGGACGRRTPHSSVRREPAAHRSIRFGAASLHRRRERSEPLRLGAEEAIASLRIALAALDSARSGEPVTLKTFAESAGGRG